MKKLYILPLLLPMMMSAQTTDQNYIKTTTYKVPETQSVSSPAKSDANIHVSYFDGLGRPLQQLEWQQSGEGKSIFTHIGYDGFGRQKLEYLPYTGREDLLFDGLAEANTLQFYTTYNDPASNPYSEKFFEQSPLNRVMKQAAPGDPWAGIEGDDSDHTVKFVYAANNDDPQTVDDRVRLFTVVNSFNNDIYDISLDESGGFYAAGQLYKTITRDENWTHGVDHTTEEFKNKQGQVLLKRTYDQGEAHNTYYVYDNYGNLTYVMPPATGIFPESLNGLCYQYMYDGRNRLAAKKLPGKGWEYIVYDRLDRPVMTGPVYSPFGDGTMGWLVTKYDVFGRVAYTAWKAGEAFETQRRNYQGILGNPSSAVSEVRTGSNVDNIQNVYSSNVFPQSGYKLLTINYYDGYDFPDPPAPVPSNVLGETVIQAPKGLATGSWTRALTAGDQTYGETMYMLYDSKGRVLQSFCLNYLGGFTNTRTNYNFIGQPVFITVRHKRSPTEDTVETVERFIYTAQDRLLTHTHAVKSLPEELMSYNEYDELGQLVRKEVGGPDVTDFTGLQRVDYQYNIRGWLKTINDVRHLNDDLFGFRIAYNDADGSVAEPLYNGNISETFWQSASDNVRRKYSYQYDALNRLRASFYERPNLVAAPANSYNESMEYDINGNIMALQRNGELDDPNVELQIDDLAYSYAPLSDRLMKVTDATNDPAGFKDDSGDFGDSADDYGYDDLGNMISDQNKNILHIAYNHLNLPVEVRVGDEVISYIYDAGGRKLSKTVPASNMQLGGEVKTDYLDGFQYENTRLKFFPHSEGYVNVLDDGETRNFNYVYNYLDHLGNIRLSYAVDPHDQVLKIVEENHYYPFGLKHKNYNMTRRQFDREEDVLALRQATPQSAPPYKYKYNAKEWQDELGLNWYDYGARNYDAAIGRWVNIDPLAEMSRRFSPYVYALDNPVSFIDADGMKADDWLNKLGEQVYNPKAKGGKGAYTKHATAQEKEFGESLRNSGTKGAEQFDFLVNTKTEVEVEFHQGDSGEAFGYHIGQTEIGYEGNGFTTNEDGSITLDKASIDVYVGTAEKLVGDLKTGKTDSKNEKGVEKENLDVIKDCKLSGKQVATANFGHEIDHLKGPNVKIQVEKKKGKSGRNSESQPLKTENTILNDLSK
jgi:RHS repeat-associated protein